MKWNKQKNYTMCECCGDGMSLWQTWVLGVEARILWCPSCGNEWNQCVECHADESMEKSNVCEDCLSVLGENEPPEQV